MALANARMRGGSRQFPLPWFIIHLDGPAFRMAFQPLLEAIIALINAMPDEPECVDDHPRWIQYSHRISLRRLAWELVPTAGGRFRTQRSFSIVQFKLLVRVPA